MPAIAQKTCPYRKVNDPKEMSQLSPHWMAEAYKPRRGGRVSHACRRLSSQNRRLSHHTLGYQEARLVLPGVLGLTLM
jgi:hypothetical protein